MSEKSFSAYKLRTFDEAVHCICKGRQFIQFPWYKCLNRTWRNLCRRCSNPNEPAYKYYGAKGIGVCEEWKSFKQFYSDMASTYRPGLSIDRINNAEGYSASNCRWVTSKIQCNNRGFRALKKGVNVYYCTKHTLTLNGETYNLIKWAILLKLPPIYLLKYYRYLKRVKVIAELINKRLRKLASVDRI